MAKTPITVAHGDGIGPEIMSATLAVLTAAGADLELETIEIGEAQYLKGHTSGIDPQAWESLRRTKLFLKAPITTPQGGGYKSLNVTIRKSMGLFANVRPCLSYHPFVETKHPKMDVVIVRENEEDLYSGIEHRQTYDVVQCLKLISRPGTEKICKYAFEYARRNNRKKVTCFTKDNIMKLTDGLFHKVFDEIAADYPDIQNEHWIVDIGAAKLADTPEAFDVIVMPNLYGDILSDVAAQIAGSVGLAGSSNIGEHGAMFEAIHGSAPRRAGQNVANPSALMLASVMLLVHIGETQTAARIHNAWLKTLEEGIHTYDIYDEQTSKQKVGTKEFAQAVVARLGKLPETLKAVVYPEKAEPFPIPKPSPRKIVPKATVGVDIWLNYLPGTGAELAAKVQPLEGDLKLMMITNRGQKYWPGTPPESDCSDHWLCRFMNPADMQPVTHEQIAALFTRLAGAGLDFIKSENLCTFDGKAQFALAQGQ